MRVAAIYDVHANLPAVEAVVEDIRQAGVNHIVVGGDVFPGPMPQETIRYLLDLDIPMRFLCGNGDREVLAQMSGVETEWYRAAPEQWREPVRWTARQLGPELRRVLAGWPKTLRFEIRGIGEVMFCHATPRNDTDCFTRLTSEDRLVPVFGGVGAPLAVCGHTHMQFDRTIGETRVVNAGSVGMPFGAPGAYWLLLGARSTSQMLLVGVVSGIVVGDFLDLFELLDEAGLSNLHSRLTVLLEMAMCPK